jgi:hypothetical protein
MPTSGDDRHGVAPGSLRHFQTGHFGYGRNKGRNRRVMPQQWNFRSSEQSAEEIR